MPCLILTSHRKESRKDVKNLLDSPIRIGPPDLIAALEFLFCILEGMGMEPPAVEWFTAEAFAALQIRNFKTSPELQHFLHRLLGSSYCGGYSFITYYLPVVYAYIMHMFFLGGVEEGRILGRLRSVLGMWNVRERDWIVDHTSKWLPRTVHKLSMFQDESTPTVAYQRVGVLQKRGIVLARDLKKI